jgi:hypothetical protein
VIVTVNPTAPHTVNTYGNLGRATATAQYSSSSGLSASSVPTRATNRIAQDVLAIQIKVTAPLLLVLGFVSSVARFLASRADARLAPLPQVSSSGLPAPRSMVVFDSVTMATTPGSPFVVLPPGGSVTIATVPTNRWLVITDYDQSRGYNVDLVEDLAGVITVKRHEIAALRTPPRGNGSAIHASTSRRSNAPRTLSARTRRTSSV